MNQAEAANRIPQSTYRARRGGRSRRAGPAPAAFLTALALVACGGPSEPVMPGPRPPAPDLPPIPAAEGPLHLRVSYPRDSLALETRRRNFIFGSAGNGEARVWVDGREVEVQPNGGFLAFLPVPEDSVYRLRAALGGETQTLEVPVRLPPGLPEPGDSATIVPETVYPSGAWVALPGERIETGFTGTVGGRAWLEVGDERIPLVPTAGRRAGATNFEVTPDDGDGGGNGAEAGAPGSGGEVGSGAWVRYRGFFDARRIVTPDTAVPWPTLTGEPRPVSPGTAVDSGGPLSAGAATGDSAGPLPDTVTTASPGPDAVGRRSTGSDDVGPQGSALATLVLAVGPDTARHPLPLNLLLAEPGRPRTGLGLDLDPPHRNGDGRVVARPGPGGGPYHYVWANGVELELTGERNGAYRVRLTDELHAWTPAGDIQLRAPGTPPPTSPVSVVRLDPQPEHVDVRIALDRRLPYRVEEAERSVAIVVYGAVSRANFLQHGRMDPYVERAEWSQPSDRVFRLDVRLTGMPWGYDTHWSGGDLVLRLNRPPAIDPRRPLRGLRVGVDPGHGGADTLTMGPTGLTEADANLGVAQALRDALERRGARVVMTRASNTTVSLVERTRLAREEDVDLWISVHNNALPDGVEPWPNSGTSVYYNHPRAAGLAWSVHQALLRELGLRDLGVGRADLHQPRFTWAPAILTETLFMMIPEHEAFLKTEAGRRRVARAHVRGIEAWLRDVAARRRR